MIVSRAQSRMATPVSQSGQGIEHYCGVVAIVETPCHGVSTGLNSILPGAVRLRGTPRRLKRLFHNRQPTTDNRQLPTSSYLCSTQTL
jgi:hypothetical protein